MANVHISDHRIATRRGTLYAKTWVPSPAICERPALLLFHDSLGCVALWRDFPEQLAIATQGTVVAYDRLGFGLSDPQARRLPLTFIRDEAESVIPSICDSLALTRIIPIGHSVGGAMAIATAARWPERCAGVITVSAQSFVEDVTLAGIRAAEANFEGPGQIERLEKYHGTKTRWVLDSWIQTWLSSAFANWNLDEDLRRMRCPILSIHGDCDEYGSVLHPQRIGTLAAGTSRTVILNGCGHIPHREHPARVIDEIATFVSRFAPVA